MREGKGAADRITVLPDKLVHPLRDQLAQARSLHARDIAAGFGAVYLPYALAQKYPEAATSWN